MWTQHETIASKLLRIQNAEIFQLSSKNCNHKTIWQPWLHLKWEDLWEIGSKNVLVNYVNFFVNSQHGLQF